MAITALFSNRTTDGVSSSVSYSSETTIDVDGVFDGAQAFVEISSDGGATFQPRAVFSNPASFNLALRGNGWQWRVRQHNSGPLTSITYKYNF